MRGKRSAKVAEWKKYKENGKSNLISMNYRWQEEDGRSGGHSQGRNKLLG